MSDHPPLEADIDDAALAALLEKHRLGAFQSARVLSATAQERQILVNDELLLRLSADRAALPRLRRSALICRRLRRTSDVPCAEVLALDASREHVPFDVLIERNLAGQRADLAWPELDLPTRERLSEDLGRLCGTLHHLPWPVYGDVDLGGLDSLVSPRWTDIINAKIERLYGESEVLALLPQPVLDELVVMLNDADALFDTPSVPTLTHTELGLWNVLLRRAGAEWEIAALIGWDRATIADAAWEFANLAREPVETYPHLDSFSYGYRERHPLQDDLGVRRRLYRLLTFWERAVASMSERGPSAPLTTYFRSGLVRLLKLR